MPNAAPPLPPVVAVGASFGGVEAVLSLAASLPAGFPAVVAIVLHIGNQPSILPELLQRGGPLPALHPRDGQPLRPGIVLVAPPDHHLLLEPGRVRLNRGPRENHARPAIDPLFRSVAIGWGRRAIGVVLTGNLDDGAAGLAAIKAAGGLAIVQDPADALAPSMPASALASVQVDHCVPLREVGPLLARLLSHVPSRPAVPVPDRLVCEQAIFEGERPLDHLKAIGHPSQLTCPECGGVMSEINGAPLRYRCHTGHAFTAMSLAHAQASQSDYSLQASLRSLKEREMLLRRMAAIAQSLGDTAQADAGRRQAERVRGQVEHLVQLMEAETRGA